MHDSCIHLEQIISISSEEESEAEKTSGFYVNILTRLSAREEFIELRTSTSKFKILQNLIQITFKVVKYLK
jgi:hypothetical protein